MQSCLTLCDPMDPLYMPGSPVHGILQARILEWQPFPSPGNLPDSGIELWSPELASLPLVPPGKLSLKNLLTLISSLTFSTFQSIKSHDSSLFLDMFLLRTSIFLLSGSSLSGSPSWSWLTFFSTEVDLIYSVVLVSDTQRSDSDTCVYLFQILFLYRLLQNIDYSSLCYIVGPCWLSILYVVVHYVNPKLLIYPSPSSPFGNPKLIFYVCGSTVWYINSFVSYF